MKTAVNIFWFRRDLRINDNAGLYHALLGNRPVIPVFIFDRDILDLLEERSDKRVEFICRTLSEMQEQLAGIGTSLEIYHDFPQNIFRLLLEKYDIEKVFTNHDYEPYARARDATISKLLNESGASLLSFKDQVIFEKNEILKSDHTPYTVFTPYSRSWRAALTTFFLKSYPSKKYFHNFHKQPAWKIPLPEVIGFKTLHILFPAREPDIRMLKNYDKRRDFPAAEGTSRLGIHLRFGTVSIREIARQAVQYNDIFLNELIWRDFYHMILWHFPEVGKGKPFKPEYERIKWRNDEAEFEKWCAGTTGYPIVDAGMRQLNATGYMHNRVRMITASFLAKHLLIDWRWGESYFAAKLLDFDLAANNGGWQWAAGCGCDAAPYFRIFNPSLQTKKFDPDLKYIRQWIPELDDFSYPQPSVDHEMARERALSVYKQAFGK